MGLSRLHLDAIEQATHEALSKAPRSVDARDIIGCHIKPIKNPSGDVVHWGVRIEVKESRTATYYGYSSVYSD